jgi:hypothetical protein
VALVTAGVDADVLGIGFEEIPDEQRNAVLSDYPRGSKFKEGIIDAFFHGFQHKPDTTFGTMNDDVLARLDPAFCRKDFCDIILNSPWQD